MNQLRRRRWIWSPITSWQARRLARVTGVDFDDAWVEIRLTTHPDERHFALAHDVLTQVLLTRSAVCLAEGTRYAPEGGTRYVADPGTRYVGDPGARYAPGGGTRYASEAGLRSPEGEGRPRDGSLRP
ncbi:MULTISPECIES: hypothetical protein [Streptomyces]|uniref:hypothetical protein n=1 Tax=Streptomyces TaxID=1883 RepID=UPI00202EC68D|nr:hypothetical protein [Streptomyces sp. G2]MCM1947301.1 hypothetical protein [Streptomyces sp. G2]